MTIYRCFFRFRGEVYYVDSDKGIPYFMGGFWVDENLQFTHLSDKLKYWIPPSKIEYIEKIMGV